MDKNNTNNDNYAAEKQKKSFFSSQERNNVIKVAKDIYKGLSTFSPKKMQSAFESLRDKLIDYLNMKEKELAGVKKDDKDTREKLKTWKDKHKNDKSGWGALITKGETILNKNEEYFDYGLLVYEAVGIGVECLYDSILAVGFPKTALLNAASAGMAVDTTDYLNDAWIDLKNKDDEEEEATKFDKGTIDKLINKDNYKKYKTYVKTLLPKIQKQALSKLKAAKNKGEIESVPEIVRINFRDKVEDFIKKEFKLNVNFKKKTAENLEATPPSQ